ncbi:MAG: hypothetical protein JOY73_02430 [Actinobacteria bacterium]|nr:hypothetical protein [Actinomycetota bacterium]
MVACTPQPGLGTVVYRGIAVNLTTCKTSPAPRSPQGPTVAGRTIVFHGKVVVRARKGDAIEADGATSDGKWVFYAIDPFSSASIAADGLAVRAVAAAGGRSYPIATGLVYASYRSWCDGRFVMTAGPDRTSTTTKWLVTSAPPGWTTRILVKNARIAFGSLTCVPDGVVVQSTAASPKAFRSPHWALWHVDWNGNLRRLTTPPAGVSDESPQYAGGVLYFVRGGWLYARNVGRLLKLPATQSYFGHTEWPYRITR